MANNADSSLGFNVAYREVKHPRLEFKTGELLLILPKEYKEPGLLVNKHPDWIIKKRAEISNALSESKNRKLVADRTDKEFKELTKTLFHKYLKGFGFDANNLLFKNMNSKWASCSPSKNITLNTRLKYLPKDLISYVIFHEVVHLKERKHNLGFWKIVSRTFDDYAEKEKELFIYWFLTQEQLAKSN